MPSEYIIFFLKDICNLYVLNIPNRTDNERVNQADLADVSMNIGMLVSVTKEEMRIIFVFL